MMENAGERFKKIRLEKGLSLEEVHRKTKIHLSILKAIEGDSLTHLSPVYLQGFVKIYCKFLGVEPKDYILEVKQEKRRVPEASQVKDAQVLSEPPRSKASEAPLKPQQPLFNIASARIGFFRQNEKIIRTAALVLVVLFISVGLFKLGKSISQKKKNNFVLERPRKEQVVQKTAKTSSKAQAQEVKPLAKAATSNPLPRANAAVAVKKDDIRLVIKARENCWVNLKADGKLVFHRVLEKGRSETWKAKERMDLSLGNAGVVEVEVDGQIFSNLGRKGQALKNITITKKGMDIGR